MSVSTDNGSLLPMDKRGKCNMLYVATAGLMSILCLRQADAAVPVSADGQAKRTSVSPARLPAPMETTSEKSRTLDLRMPEEIIGEHHAPFTSFSRHDLVSMHEDSEAAPSSNIARADNERKLSRTEVLVNQFRRQGLPVARLWENDSALVHLGLNQKGKPGLWIVQKIH